jgi:hypothetical protein
MGMTPPQRPVFGGGQGPSDVGQAYRYVNYLYGRDQFDDILNM